MGEGQGLVAVGDWEALAWGWQTRVAASGRLSLQS